jgi:uncharacterized RDD family membrane protein YckC
MKCPKCNAEQKGAIEACSACGAYLLPRRTAGDRVLGLVGGLVLLTAIICISIFVKQPASFWIALFILGGPTAAAFTYAFSKFPPAKAYAQRAKGYIKSEPEQAITDITKAIELTSKNVGPYYLQRAQIYEQVGQPEAALHDLQKIRELSRGERGNIQVSAVEKEIQRLTQKSPEVAAAAEAAAIVVVPYVGFLRRLFAFIIDGVILTLVAAGIQAAMGLEAKTAVFVVWVVLYLAYFIGFWVWRGQTPGKMVTGIRIVHGESASVGIVPVIVRVMVYPVSIALSIFTWLMIEVDSQKRALHDYVAGTRVIRGAGSQPIKAKQ